MKKFMKNSAALLMSAMVIAGSTMTVMAAEWQQNSTGWWYDNGNGTWPANSWQWIDGNSDGVAECYYFDGNGYMLSNTTTPDGYQVDASGAWVVNGVVQTQGNVNVGSSADGKIDIVSYGYTNGVSNIAIEMTTASRADLIAEYGAESITNDTGRGIRVYAYANIPFEMEYDIPIEYSSQMDSVQSGTEVKNLGGEVTVTGSPSNMVEDLLRDNLSVEEMADYLRPYGYIKSGGSIFNNRDHFALTYYMLWDYPGYEFFKFNIY